MDQLRRMRELINYRGFDPRDFEGKSINEYQFPEELILKMESDCGFSKQDEVIICFPKERGCLVLLQFVLMIPFALVGLVTLVCGSYFITLDIFEEKADMTSSIFLFVFGAVWLIISYFLIRSEIKRILFTYWFKITPDGFECYYGREFNPREAMKFTLYDCPTFTKDSHKVITRGKHSSSTSSIYELYICDQNQKFHINYMSVYQSDYIFNFLNYHLKNQKEKRENPNREDWILV